MGKIDMFVKGGAQWNKVPFPLLIMPAANLSYILQRETFNLINNMEFLKRPLRLSGCIVGFER